MRETTRRFIGFGLAIACLALFVGGIAGILKALASPNNTKDTVDIQVPMAVWPSNRHGLDITIIHACDSSWTQIFNLYVYAWDNGTPDALTLSTEKQHYDKDCQAVAGRIKVCNGDYGFTDWAGVAYSFRRASTGLVVSSTILLNDFHLKDASSSQRKYVMCHELGHAFGLPHTDEDHWNEDTGECMNYSVRFGNNLNPGQVNFDRLYELYGSVDNTKESNINSRSLTSKDTVVDREAMEKFNAVVKCLSSSTLSSLECKKELPFVDDTSGKSLLDNSSIKHGDLVEEFYLDGFVVQRRKLPLVVSGRHE